MRAGHFKRNYENAGVLGRLIIRAACSLISVGIVQADSLKDQFDGLIPRRHIKRIYNAVDTAFYNNGPSATGDPMKVFFMGHISCAKGYCDILKALPAIAEKYPEIVFQFAGTKLQEERNIFFNQLTGEPLVCEDPDACYVTYIKDRFDKNYRYLGVVGEREKLKLFKECGIFLLPTYSEGFSMAILEAMAMGKAIICTPVGALGEIMVDGLHGLLLLPGDIERLKSHIVRLIEDPTLRHTMGAANRLYAVDNFTIEKISGQLGDCFEELLSTQRHGKRYHS